MTKTKKIYIVTDLGPGDGGKGGVVHKIATMMRAHTIIKVGGAQGSHGVVTSRGEKFAFSQWGCGTLDGIKTHISNRLIVHPEGLLNEANMLRYGAGVHDPFGMLTIDENALCATPYHGIASRLKEMARGKNPRGTIGTGVGEAYRYFQWFPELTIRVRDLGRSDIRYMLAAVRAKVQQELDPIIHGQFLPDDLELAQEEINLLYDDDFLMHIEKCSREVVKQAQIVDYDYLGREILSQDGIAVVESSHGVLTDHYHGFYPYTSAIRTLPRLTSQALLQEASYNGQIVNIGVHRAYGIRHGAGSMPTADPRMVENLLPGSHKEKNRFQGKIRVGALDMVLLRYAIEACGGPSAFDGLAISWFDQILLNGVWHICYRYHRADDQTYFTPNGKIRVRRGEDDEQLKYQEQLGQKLFNCKPEITSINIPTNADQDDLYALCATTIQNELGVPVRMVSLGPTELDKVCK